MVETCISRIKLPSLLAKCFTLILHMCFNRSNASNSFGVFDNIKAVREGWKAKYAAGTKGFFDKIWQHFVVHHP